MKPKEYAKKFTPWHPDLQDEFTETFKGDILSTIETVYSLGGNRIALKRMESLTKEAKEKFEAIKFFIPEITNGIWSHIEKGTINPTKQKLCAGEISENKRYAQERKKRDAFFQSHFDTRFGAKQSPEDFFNFLAGMMRSQTNGHDQEALVFFELKLEYTTEDVNKAFKKKALVAHPDCGGSHKDFLHLTEMKNRALRHAK